MELYRTIAGFRTIYPTGPSVFIQRFQPDAYFTAAQYCRMQELLARRATLTTEECNELGTLIDAELAATVARTESLIRPRQP